MFLGNKKLPPVQTFFSDAYAPYVTQPGAHTLKTLSHLNIYRTKGGEKCPKQLRITNKLLQWHFCTLGILTERSNGRFFFKPQENQLITFTQVKFNPFLRMLLDVTIYRLKTNKSSISLTKRDFSKPFLDMISIFLGRFFKMGSIGCLEYMDLMQVNSRSYKFSFWYHI